MSDAGPVVVCVLGPPRSGTSLTTRMLNLIGVDLGGEENLNRPLPTSRLWEHRGIVELNERILRKLGGEGLAPPVPAPGWQRTADLAAEREDARRLLERAFAASPLWGWKDPRTCVTLPFWQELVPRLRYAICARNPIDAVASISRNARVPPAQMFRSWLVYAASALANTAGARRAVFSYERYFSDSGAQIERLAQLAGRPLPPPESRAGGELRSIANERLWHVRTPSAGELDGAPAPAELGPLHRALERLREAEEDSHVGGAAERLGREADAYAGELLAKLSEDRGARA